MNFNIKKYHLLHVRNNNPQIKYSMDNVQLKNVVKGKTLVSTDLKPNLQCADVVKTTNKLVSFIGRTFESKSENNNTSPV